jgi:ubiquinone/menaquinone biosynthesis C-methylase UbiE
MTDPEVPDWSRVHLPDVEADRLCMAGVGGVIKLIRRALAKPQVINLEAGNPYFANIPKYALQEFHNLPNGNYSNRVSRGYITGFDVSMRGHAQATRQAITQRVAQCESVLDIGTGGGKLAAEIRAAGPQDVWGIDVSPYLLKHAAADHGQVSYIQAPAEAMPFASARFDAVVACFLFHELPPKYAAQALGECYRVLRPGGRLLIAEPSAKQLKKVRWRSLLSRAGWRHVYFKALARFVYEPFVMAWHKVDKPALFAQAGFSLLEHRDQVPVNFYVLRKTQPPEPTTTESTI